MLFNSYPFLLLFLPAAIALCRLVDPYPALRVPSLVATSLVFYGYWDPRFLALLIPSILINWGAARLYVATRVGAIIIAAIAVDLAVLGFFKYANFFAANLLHLAGADWHHLDIVLPLGISFFTFHHIMYLVDLRRGIAPAMRLDTYALYICFFPQVLSGPLVRWSEVIDQFGRAAFAGGWEHRCALGLCLIVLGLAQKTLLGDALAGVVNPLFGAAEGMTLPDGAAYVAVLGFAFQIFFDFSAYSDIAIGTALIFGISLPLNFDGPYRATSIREFWRRWHMTLSRFLRDYLYIPMGGNRRGLARQMLAILATMLLGGLWHGAGWNFVFWGGLHGTAIAAVTIWNVSAPKSVRYIPAPLGWALTFGFVTLSWVFFRSASIAGALNIFRGLLILPIGHDVGGWRTVAIAAFCAIVLPPTHKIARRMTTAPRAEVAIALAIAGIIVTAQIGRYESFEFIYFRF